MWALNKYNLTPRFGVLIATVAALSFGMLAPVVVFAAPAGGGGARSPAPSGTTPTTTGLANATKFSTGGVDCVLKFDVGTGYQANSIVDSRIGNSAVGITDKVSVYSLQNNPAYANIIDSIKAVESRPYFYLEPTSPGANNINVRACHEYGVFISDSISPYTFYGVRAGDSVISSLSPAGVIKLSTNFVTVSASSFASRPPVYFVADTGTIPGIAGALTQPPFGGGAGTATTPGSCAQYTCTAQFLDFATINYAGDTYSLQQWSNGGRMEYWRIGVGGAAEQCRYFNIDSDANGEALGSQANLNGEKGYDINIDNGTQSEVQSVFDAFNFIATQEYVTLHYNSGVSGCTPDKFDVQKGFNTTNFRKIFKYDDKAKSLKPILQNYGSNEGKYLAGEYKLHTGTTDTFEIPANDRCKNDPSTIKLDSVPTAGGGDVQATWSYIVNTDNCFKANMKLTVGILTEAERVVADKALASVANKGQVAPPKTCQTTWRSPVAWIFCGIISLAEDMANKMESVVQDLLRVDISKFDNGGGLYSAWSNIRQVATIILVIIALVMIFTEAMGSGILDNYSVKKILPRIVFAGIGIQLSWLLCKELLNLGNILGNGIEGLLLAPFGGKIGVSLSDIISYKTVADHNAGVQVGLAVALVVGGAVAFGAVVSSMVGILIALIIAYITLVLRYMVIIMCVLFSPIAIALAVLPGTNKLAKLWWESFKKAVVMYPVIMAMFAAGKIVAYGLVAGSKRPDGTQDGWFVLAAIIAYFLPWALVPAALKAGGAALNKVTGTFNDKTKGGFDKMRNYTKKRQEFNKKIKDNQLAIKAGAGGVIAGMRMRSRQGQPVTGLALRKGRRDAIERTSLGLQKAASEQATKEADAQLQTSSMYGDVPALLARAQSSHDPSEVQAIVDRLVTLKRDGEVATLMGVSGNRVLTAALQSSINSGKVAASFGDKASDVARATPNTNGSFDLNHGSLQGATADEASKWSTRTLNTAVGMRDHDTSDAAAVTAAVNDQAARLAHITGLAATNPNYSASLNPEKRLALQAALQANATARGVAYVAPTYIQFATTTPPPSDRRLKKKIRLVGSKNGIKLYSYQYLWSEQVYVGVMAQDLVHTHPEALSKDRYGYYRVDYSKLGLKLLTIEQWQEANCSALQDK